MSITFLIAGHLDSAPSEHHITEAFSGVGDSWCLHLFVRADFDLIGWNTMPWWLDLSRCMLCDLSIIGKQTTDGAPADDIRDGG